LPDPSRAFSIEIEDLSDLVDEAIVVLDINILLIPFSLNNNTLEVIKKINDDERLFIPGQVAREYLKNKPTKIVDIH
jgi:rRNA-processing protein FCF1